MKRKFDFPELRCVRYDFAELPARGLDFAELPARGFDFPELPHNGFDFAESRACEMDHTGSPDGQVGFVRLSQCLSRIDLL